MQPHLNVVLTLLHSTDRMIVPHSRLRNLRVGYVAGIEVEGKPGIKLQYGFSGRESKMRISAPRPFALRVLNFIESCYTPRSFIPPFDCHSFMRYAAGFDSYIQNGRVVYDGTVVRPGPLRPFSGFIMKRDLDAYPDHCFASLPGPYDLSAFGDNSPLIVARNKDIMDAYGTNILMSVNSVRRL